MKTFIFLVGLLGLKKRCLLSFYLVAWICAQIGLAQNSETKPNVTATSSSGPKFKKLIEFGRDEPDPIFMRQNIAQMEQAPFHGTVFGLHVEGDRSSDTGFYRRFEWQCWGTREFTKAEFQSQIADYKATPFKRFTDNFLRLNAMPGLDWFDDFKAVVKNMRLAAEMAKEMGCKGIKLDLEEYDKYAHPSNPSGGKMYAQFTYADQPYKSTKTWEQYAAQAKLRGKEVMQALQEGYPGITVFLSIGYSGCYHGTKEGTLPISEVRYGLLAPFMDGMHEAASPGVKLIDGTEHAYYQDEPWQYDYTYDQMTTKIFNVPPKKPIIGNKDKFFAHYSLAFAYWLDIAPYDTKDLSKNRNSPEKLQKKLEAGLRKSHDYAWIYTDLPAQWWPMYNGTFNKIPAPYYQAISNALISVNGSFDPSLSSTNTR